LAPVLHLSLGPCLGWTCLPGAFLPGALWQHLGHITGLCSVIGVRGLYMKKRNMKTELIQHIAIEVTKTITQNHLKCICIYLTFILNAYV
jgi:hypothetical protein